jgi:threonyl-tRNA synthetase
MSSPIEVGVNRRRRTIQRAEQIKVHTMFVIGKRDMDANAVSVRVHGKGNLGAQPRAEAIAEILQSIKERHG